MTASAMLVIESPVACAICWANQRELPLPENQNMIGNDCFYMVGWEEGSVRSTVDEQLLGINKAIREDGV